MRPVNMNAEPRGKVPSPRQLTGGVTRGVSWPRPSNSTGTFLSVVAINIVTKIRLPYLVKGWYWFWSWLSSLLYVLWSKITAEKVWAYLFRKCHEVGPHQLTFILLRVVEYYYAIKTIAFPRFYFILSLVWWQIYYYLNLHRLHWALIKSMNFYDRHLNIVSNKYYCPWCIRMRWFII